MAIKNYETVFIMTPVLSDTQMKETVDKFRNVLKSNGAELVHEENWGLKKLAYPIQKKILLDSEMIRNVVLNNPQILSVEHLAEHFKTSVVQLNRHLKKEELSGLNLLKSIKKEIALEMLKDGKSLEEISKRVGYSMRYVKAKLLKD